MAMTATTVGSVGCNSQGSFYSSTLGRTVPLPHYQANFDEESTLMSIQHPVFFAEGRDLRTDVFFFHVIKNQTGYPTPAGTIVPSGEASSVTFSTTAKPGDPTTWIYTDRVTPYPGGGTWSPSSVPQQPWHPYNNQPTLVPGPWTTTPLPYYPVSQPLPQPTIEPIDPDQIVRVIDACIAQAKADKLHEMVVMGLEQFRELLIPILDSLRGNRTTDLEMAVRIKLTQIIEAGKTEVCVPDESEENLI